MMKILGLIDASTKTTGTRAAQNDPLYDNFVWQSPSALLDYQPTVRLDYNISGDHRLSGSWASIMNTRTPDYLNNTDARFPGAPNVARLQVHAAPGVGVAPLGADQEHRQRAARRL